MAISKIILNGVTQMDLTADTTDAAKTLASYTGHGADGEAFTGNYVAPTYEDGDNLSYGSEAETWLFNSTIATTLTINDTFHVNFSSNNTDYAQMRLMIIQSPVNGALISYANSDVYNSLSGGWTDEAYRTIVITGGVDVQDADFRSFLTANAVLQ